MKKIFLCTVLCVCSILMVGCLDKEEPVDKVEKEQLSGKFFEDQTVDGLKIKNFSIANENDESYISFVVENTLSTEINVEHIKVSLYDKDDYLILELYGYVGETLSSKGTKNVVVESDIDLSNIVRVVYEKM